MHKYNLTQRLTFKDDDVILDGVAIFSMPHRYSMSEINLLSVDTHGKSIYVGSGKCCHGLIAILTNSDSKTEPLKFTLDSIRVPDFNVYDIIPAIVHDKKTGFPNENAILTTGSGCAGSGVRLLSAYFPKTIEVVSGEEYGALRGDKIHAMPRLNVSKDKITLDFLKAGYRLLPGKVRDPNLPSACGDINAEEWHVSQDICASKDLTQKLAELGVDLYKTLIENAFYARIRS